MKLQLKYDGAAILDWQGSERMLNSQRFPLAVWDLTSSEVSHMHPCWVSS